jgi:GNAT superfamily N-acetyltransferase
MTPVKTFYLEMKSRDQFRPAAAKVPPLDVRQAKIACPELNRWLYSTVGAPWKWTDKLPWTIDQWKAWADRPELTTWIGYAQGTPAGYFELENLPETGVEIAYFGLLPQFVGKGLGGTFLSACVESAWSLGPGRVWVHTCTLDHESALANYQARGFSLYKEEISK